MTMALLTTKHNQRKTAAMILLALLPVIFCHPGVAGEFEVSDADSNETIMVNNVWVEVPLGQIFRDI